MVDVKISELPVAGSAAGTDQLEANQAGTSRSITVAQVGTALALTGYAPLASPVFTGDPQAPTPATADSDTSIATSAFVKAQGYQTAAQVTTSLGSYLPLTGGTLAGPGTLTGTAATFTGALTGTTATFNAGASTPAFRATGNDAVLLGLFNGATKGVRITTDASQVKIEGVDNTGVGSFQPLTLGGSIVQVGAQLSGTTAVFSGTVSAPGAQIQMVFVETGTVATGSTLVPFDNTIPQITEGDQYMTLAITPKSATSKLIIEVTALIGSTVANSMGVALFQDATANALAAAHQTIAAAGQNAMVSFRHMMTSGTTSATTFRVRIGGAAAGTTQFNGNGGTQIYGGVAASSIVIREVA